MIRKLLFAAAAVLLTATACAAGAREEGKVPVSTERLSPEAVYRIGLGQYIRNELPLDGYEEEIAALGCAPVPPEEQTRAQKDDWTGTEFIYMRNGIHLEVLSPEDAELLKSGMMMPDGTLNSELQEMIVRTFPAVIRAGKKDLVEGKEGMAAYDTDIFGEAEEYLVPENALVLQVAVSAGEGKILSDSVETENSLYELSKRMEKEMDGTFADVPVRVRIRRVAVSQ